MQVLIIGCGKIGQELAIDLVSQEIDVVVIDSDESKLERLKDCDLVRICGVPIDLDVLEKAGAGTADAVLCVSDSENLNVMAGQMARHIFEVDQVIVRTFLTDNSPIYEAMGLTPVCITSLTVDRVIEIIAGQAARTRFDVFGTAVELATVRAESDWCGRTAGSLTALIGGTPVAVYRDGALQMSTADLVVEPGDEVVIARLAEEA